MRIHIQTLGCPKNLTDSEGAAGILEKAGHSIVGDIESADVILVNTCGFIQDAKEESIDRILEMAEIKQGKQRLIVTGCLSQRYGEKLKKELPEVDAFLGVNDYANLPEILNTLETESNQLYLSNESPLYPELKERHSLGVSYSAYLKIAEGCDNHCAYCSIPGIRGAYRSRSMENVLQEAERLVAAGCKEIILVAQDVTAYGVDIYGEYKLPTLVEKLSAIDDLQWIRLMYCYEDRISDALIKVMAENEKVCRYIDIPIQHASDKILSSMGRRSTRASITETLQRLRKAIPDIHIRTTLITGFPGENEEDFEVLRQFVEEMKFERLGVFAYSKEEGTVAGTMKNQVRKEVKHRRREDLMSLQREISLAHNLALVGKRLPVLIEGKEEGAYIGRSPYDAPEIDNSVIVTSETPLEPGMIVSVEITDGFDYDLCGTVMPNQKGESV